MRKGHDDIYSKEQVPRFAKRKTSRSSRSGGKEDSQPDRMMPPHLSNLSKRKRRSSRRKQGNKLSIAILLGLITVMVVYIGILGISLVRKLSGDDKEKSQVTKKDPGYEPDKTENAAKPDAVTVNDESLTEELMAFKQNQLASLDVLSKFNLIRSTEGEQKALEQLEKQYKATPEIHDLQTGLAQVYIRMGKWPEARKLLVPAMKTMPRNTMIKELLAKCLLEESNLKSAYAMADWALSVDRYSVDALNIQAQVHMKSGNMAAAVKKLQRVIDIEKTNLSALNNLGFAHMKQKQYDRAIKSFELVLQQDKVNSMAFYNLAISYANKAGDILQQPAATPMQRSQADKDIEASVDYLSRGANHFGNAFVSTWIKAPDFEPIRQHPRFRAAVSIITGNDDAGDADQGPLSAQVDSPLVPGGD